ncbi:sensor histidine kinase, partial [Qipengyuania sp.]|uniref:sensor histidine kinase n=1 Tax=Qipengyuania sp. TaxID=2004515 RepID=UPI0035C7BF1C
AINRRIHDAIGAGVEVQLDAPDSAVIIAGHRTLLFEIVSNLLDNAIRYIEGGSSITVTIIGDEASASIAVADDGPGISDDNLGRLGERFVRFSTSVGQEGSGLGLAIVHSAAQRLGARLEFTNTKPGLRATLTFEDLSNAGFK